MLPVRHSLTAEVATTIEVMSAQSLASVKARFSHVIDEVSGTHERVTVTKNGSPVVVILAVERCSEPPLGYRQGAPRSSTAGL